MLVVLRHGREVAIPVEPGPLRMKLEEIPINGSSDAAAKVPRNGRNIPQADR